MNDKVPTPVDGDDNRKGALDGVSGAPGKGKGEGVSGRSASGEAGGGSYPNPYSDNTDAHRVPLTHGGQSEMKYFGAGQAGSDGRAAPNAVAGSNEADDSPESELAPPSVERQPRAVRSGGRSFDVVDDSGVAAAEAQGRIRSDASDPKDEGGLAG